MPNRRDAIRMDGAEIERFLAGRHVMNVATRNPDGTIHLVPMWYGFLDGAPAFETYARSQKVRNLERDARLTVLVEDGERYDELRGVQIVGRAELVEDHDVVVALAEQVIRRYEPLDGDEAVRAAAEVMAAKRVAIRVVAERTVSWDHRKLSS